MTRASRSVRGDKRRRSSGPGQPQARDQKAAMLDDMSSGDSEEMGGISGSEAPTPQSHTRDSLVQFGEYRTSDGICPIEFPRGQIPRKHRVNRIVDLMLEQKWERGQTALELAKEWGHTVHAIERDASDAKLLLDLAREPEAVREKCLVHLNRVIDESGNDRVKAMELALKATGNLVDRHELTHTAKAGPEMFAAALEHAPFREWLIAQGWSPPGALLLTDGSEVE